MSGGLPALLRFKRIGDEEFQSLHDPKTYKVLERFESNHGSSIYCLMVQPVGSERMILMVFDITDGLAEAVEVYNGAPGA